MGIMAEKTGTWLMFSRGCPQGASGQEVQSGNQGTDDYHLSGNVFQGHAELGRIACLQSEKRYGHLGTVHHALLFYHISLGVPVDPEVCTRSVSLPSNHSHRKSERLA